VSAGGASAPLTLSLLLEIPYQMQGIAITDPLIHCADGNHIDRRKAKLTKYFGFGLAGNVLFTSGFYFLN